MPRAPSSRLTIHRLMRDHFDTLQQRQQEALKAGKPSILTTENFKQMELASKVESNFRGGKPAEEKDDEETPEQPAADDGLAAQSRLDQATDS